jgi:hypothetical protein
MSLTVPLPSLFHHSAYLYRTLHSGVQADETDTTQEILGKTIAEVFGVKFGFHNIIQSQIAQFKINDVAGVRFPLQGASGVAILTPSFPSLSNHHHCSHSTPHRHFY